MHFLVSLLMKIIHSSRISAPKMPLTQCYSGGLCLLAHSPVAVRIDRFKTLRYNSFVLVNIWVGLNVMQTHHWHAADQLCRPCRPTGRPICLEAPIAHSVQCVTAAAVIGLLTASVGRWHWQSQWVTLSHVPNAGAWESISTGRLCRYGALAVEYKIVYSKHRVACQHSWHDAVFWVYVLSKKKPSASCWHLTEALQRLLTIQPALYGMSVISCRPLRPVQVAGTEIWCGLHSLEVWVRID